MLRDASGTLTKTDVFYHAMQITAMSKFSNIELKSLGDKTAGIETRLNLKLGITFFLTCI